MMTFLDLSEPEIRDKMPTLTRFSEIILGMESRNEKWKTLFNFFSVNAVHNKLGWRFVQNFQTC